MARLSDLCAFLSQLSLWGPEKLMTTAAANDLSVSKEKGRHFRPCLYLIYMYNLFFLAKVFSLWCNVVRGHTHTTIALTTKRMFPKDHFRVDGILFASSCSTLSFSEDYRPIN